MPAPGNLASPRNNTHDHESYHAIGDGVYGETVEFGGLELPVVVLGNVGLEGRPHSLHHIVGERAGLEESSGSVRVTGPRW